MTLSMLQNACSAEAVPARTRRARLGDLLLAQRVRQRLLVDDPPRARLTRKAEASLPENLRVHDPVRFGVYGSGAPGSRGRGRRAPAPRARPSGRSFHGPRRRGDSDDRHPERLAFRSERPGDRSTPKMRPSCLEQLRGIALPFARVPVAHGARRSRASASISMTAASARITVQAVHVGDQHFLRTAGGRRCRRRPCRAPGSTRASSLLEHVIGHVRAEGEQDVGIADEGSTLEW